MPTVCSPLASSRFSKSWDGPSDGNTRPCVGCHGGKVLKTLSRFSSAHDVGTSAVGSSAGAALVQLVDQTERADDGVVYARPTPTP